MVGLVNDTLACFLIRWVCMHEVVTTKEYRMGKKVSSGKYQILLNFSCFSKNIEMD